MIRKLFYLCAALGLAPVLPALAQDEDPDEEPDVEFLIIEQPEVQSAGSGGYAKVNIGLHKSEASGATIEVRSPNGYAASWNGKPGTRATFGMHDAGDITVLVDGEPLSVKVPKQKGKEAKEGGRRLCWMTVRSNRNKRGLLGKCVTEPPPIQITEASCYAPITPPTAGIALLENVGNMMGCVAWRYERASNLAMKAQTDMALALGMKDKADAAKRRLDNLNGVEDPLESQSLRAQAMADTALLDAIAEAARTEQTISSEAMAAITKADQMRIAANKVAAPIPGKIAEMTTYITVTVAAYVADLTQEGVNAATDPFAAAAFAIKLAKVMAELRPLYIKNVLNPLGKMIKQSGDLYRAADSKLEQALLTFYTTHDATPPDPAAVAVETFESDGM